MIGQTLSHCRVVEKLGGPGICTIHDIDDHEGKPFIVMELMEGHTLKHQIDGKPMRTELLLELGVQI
ncbi:MAG TPA: hypothetical protein VFM88_20930, partial [Vicinamibacteria bacterium]|nr:hypothetical protein [Vicinamibacteria bacterium]